MKLFQKILTLSFVLFLVHGLYQLQAMNQDHEFDTSNPGNFVTSISNKIQENNNQYFLVIIQLRSFFDSYNKQNPGNTLISDVFQFAVKILSDQNSINLVQAILLAVDQNPIKLSLKTDAHRLLEKTFKLPDICESFEKKIRDKDQRYDDVILTMLTILMEYNIPIVVSGTKFDLNLLAQKAINYNNSICTKQTIPIILGFLQSGLIDTSSDTNIKSSNGIKIIYQDPFNYWLQRNLNKSL